MFPARTGARAPTRASRRAHRMPACRTPGSRLTTPARFRAVNMSSICRSLIASSSGATYAPRDRSLRIIALRWAGAMNVRNSDRNADRAGGWDMANVVTVAWRDFDNLLSVERGSFVVWFDDCDVAHVAF